MSQFFYPTTVLTFRDPIESFLIVQEEEYAEDAESLDAGPPDVDVLLVPTNQAEEAFAIAKDGMLEALNNVNGSGFAGTVIARWDLENGTSLLIGSDLASDFTGEPLYEAAISIPQSLYGNAVHAQFERLHPKLQAALKQLPT